MHRHPYASCVSCEQALRGYTVDAAFAAFQEKKLGQIAEGFFADFVAIDRDILDEAKVPDADIWQTAILGTFTGGESAWAHPCWQKRGQSIGVRDGAGAGSLAQRGLAAMRACIEEARAQAEQDASGARTDAEAEKAAKKLQLRDVARWAQPASQPASLLACHCKWPAPGRA